VAGFGITGSQTFLFYNQRVGELIVPVLLFNWAPRHEGVLGEWKYSSTHSWPRYQMEVSGQPRPYYMTFSDILPERIKFALRYYSSSRGSSVSIVTRLRTGRPGFDFRLG